MSNFSEHEIPRAVFKDNFGHLARFPVEQHHFFGAGMSQFDS